MSIRRKKNKTGNFTILSNEIFRDPRITMKAKGLYAYLMTLPDDWKIYKSELHKAFADGKDATRSAFDELIQFGYIVSESSNSQQGRVQWTHTVYEASVHVGFSDMGKSDIGKPDTTNDLLLLRTEEDTKDSCASVPETRYTDSFEAWWKTYKRSGSSKAEAFKEWKAAKLEGQHEMMIEKTIQYRASVEASKFMKHANRFIKSRTYEAEFFANDGQAPYNPLSMGCLG
jgi:hypothetical protein